MTNKIPGWSPSQVFKSHFWITTIGRVVGNGKKIKDEMCIILGMEMHNRSMIRNFSDGIFEKVVERDDEYYGIVRVGIV